MKKGFYIILLLGIITGFTSCKKCYTCQARKANMNQMVDFEKSCDESEWQTMEDSFRSEYPDTMGYFVVCN